MSAIKISDYTASVVGTDWTPAILAAMDTIKTKGGTIEIDTDIQIESLVRVSDVLGWVNYVPLNFKNSGGNQVRFKVPADIALYGNGNLIRQKFEALNVIGSPEHVPGQPDYTSCSYGIVSMPTGTFLIDSCMFAGVAAANSIIRAVSNPGNLTIRNTSFSGCGAGEAVVFANNAETLMLDDVRFYDYENFRNTYYNKQGYPSYWVKAVYTGTPTTSHVPLVHLKNVRTDEGTNFCYIEGYPRVIIEQCASNLNGVGGQGIYLKNVEHAIISQFWAGYPAQDNPAIRLERCGRVMIDGLKLHNGIRRIVIDGETDFVEIRNSPGVVIDAAAGAEYSIDGIVYKGRIRRFGRKRNT